MNLLMGNDLTPEIKAVIKKVLDLKRDSSNWKSVIDEFITVMPADFVSKKFEEKKIIELILDLLKSELDLPASAAVDTRGICNLLEAARRLLRFKGLYKVIPKMTIQPWIQALKCDQNEIVEAAICVIRNLIEYNGAEVKEESQSAMETANRDLFFQAKGYETLCELIMCHSGTDRWIIIAGALRIFTLVLLTSSKSTAADCVPIITGMLQNLTNQFLFMSTDSNPDICYFGILTVQALILHSDSKMTKAIQTKALTNGTLLKHFFIAVNGENHLQLAQSLKSNAKSIVLECRNLIGLLTDGHTKGTDTLQRCLPNHLLKRLWENHPFPKYFTFTKIRGGITTTDATWQRYQKGSQRANWVAVFSELDKEHKLPHLIWNDVTKGELIATLTTEVAELEHQQKKNAAAEWDYEGFEVHYWSVEAELQVHGYYLRMLIPALQDPSSAYEISQKELVALINHLYNHAVIEDGAMRKLACLTAMSALYKRYSQVLLDFEPLAYLVWLMSPKHTRPLWRDHILDFFKDVLNHQPNARRFMQTEGIKFLVTYMSQAHAGTHRSLTERHKSIEPKYAIPIKVPPLRKDELDNEQPATISEESESNESDAAWFGPVSPTLSNGQLADVCIDLIKLLFTRVPRLCKSITKTTDFQHILQFLLSPDRSQSCRIMPLINQLALSAPTAMSSLQHRGAFLFALHAIGDRADISIIQFLQSFHMKQEDDSLSALFHLLPFPMIRYLQLQSAERFLEVFDGELDQADLIWGPSMRNRLLQSVQYDMEHFVKALADRPMAIYTYSEPTRVVYPEILEEVCAGGIYLRNFVINPTFAIHDPAYMMNGFVEAMRTGLKDADLELLIQSQIIAADRFPDLQMCSSYPIFPDLLRIVIRDICQDLDLRLVHKASELLLRLLIVPNSQNLHSCLQEDAIVAISQSLLNIVQLDSEDPLMVILIQKLLQILNILSFANDEAVLTIHENPQVLIELVALISGQYAQLHPDIAIEAIRLFRVLADSPIMAKDFLTSGAVVCLLNIAIFFDEYTELVKEATLSLSTISAAHDGHETDRETRAILRMILTPGLHSRLSKPDRFIKECRSGFHNPVLIWGTQQRKELQEYLKVQMEHVSTAKVWNYKESPFEFSGIKDEIVVDDIYLRLYNNQEEFQIPNDPEEFMIALIDQVQTVSATLVTVTSQSAATAASVCAVVDVIAVALKRAIKNTPSLMNTPTKDRLIHVLNGMFDTLNPEVVHAALLVLDCLSSNPVSVPVAIQYALVLHRIVNFERKNMRDNPSLELTLRILHSLCRQDNEVVDAFIDDGFVVSLMNIICVSGLTIPEARSQCASLLGVLVHDPRKGEGYLEILTHMLAHTFTDCLVGANENPKALIDFYDEDHDTPVEFWTSACREDLVIFLKSEMAGLLTQQHAALEYGVGAAPHQWNWAGLAERFHQPTLGSQLLIDGIYIDAFNSNPYFQVKPDKFFLKLIEALYGVYGEYESFRETDNAQMTARVISSLEAIWEAVLNLLTNLPHLQDRCVDYLDYIFGYFHPSVDTALQQVALNVAGILATNSLCAENIAKFRLVKNIMPLLETLNGDAPTMQVLTFLMDVIRRSSPVVAQIKSTGGIIMLINIVINNRFKKEVRETAAMIISAMVQDNVYGIGVSQYVVVCLTDKFRSIFQARPAKFIEFVDASHSSTADERQWNEVTRVAAVKLFSEQSDELATAMWFWDGDHDIFDLAKLAAIWDDVREKQTASSGTKVPEDDHAALKSLGDELDSLSVQKDP